jgi:Predicted integral membrane protein
MERKLEVMADKLDRALWLGHSNVWLILLLALAFGTRVVLSMVSCDIIDVQNYARVATIVKDHGVFALYTQTTGIYPYPPLWIWLEMLAHFLSEASRLRFGLLARFPAILADVGIVCIVWAWHSGQTIGKRLLWSAIYALNPVSLIITCLHGQFDAIPAFFALFAVYAVERRHRPYLSAVILALAIAFKPYPVLFLPLIVLELKNIGRELLFATIAIAPVLLLILPFGLHTPEAVVREVFLYKGAALLGMLVPMRVVYVPLMHNHFPVVLTQQIIAASRWLFLSGYAGLVVWQARRQVPLLAGCVAVLLWFYTAYAGIAPQYLIWALPFLLTLNIYSVLLPGSYTLASMLALYGFYAYAVPETFCFLPALPAWLPPLLYGLFGSLWWLVSGMLLGWIVKKRPFLKMVEL